MHLTQTSCVGRRRARAIRTLEWSASGGDFRKPENYGDHDGRPQNHRIPTFQPLRARRRRRDRDLRHGRSHPAGARGGDQRKFYRERSADRSDSPVGYFPNQYVNQAREVEPVRETF